MSHFKNEFREPNKAQELKAETERSVSRIEKDVGEKWAEVRKTWDSLDRTDWTVYTGTSGIALLQLKKCQYEDDPEYLRGILPLLAFTKAREKNCSFLLGDAGPISLSAVVHHRLKDTGKSQQFVSALLKKQDEIFREDCPDELLYGRAGYLYALLYVNKNISSRPVPNEAIRSVITAILKSGVAESKWKSSKSPLLYRWQNEHYVGAAHGIAGVLYVLLQANRYLQEEELVSLILPSIAYLTSLKTKSGDYPVVTERLSEHKTQWCHGTPGLVHLYAAAYRVFKDGKFLKLALECGDVVWERGLLKKGYSLCHGVAGNAYSFLELYQTTKDPKHLYRALKFAEWCLDYTRDREDHYPDHPDSLFEGVAGRMYLFLDIQRPLDAKLPGFSF